MNSTAPTLSQIIRASAFVLAAAGTCAIVLHAPKSEKAATRLGDYLRESRRATGLSLRGVEAKTRVTNGYLSQIESNAVDRPSPNVLWSLAETYGIDYEDLLVRAGHRVPRKDEGDRPAALAGIPLRALEELTEAEAADLRSYLAFIQQRRKG